MTWLGPIIILLLNISLGAFCKLIFICFPRLNKQYTWCNISSLLSMLGHWLKCILFCRNNMTSFILFSWNKLLIWLMRYPQRPWVIFTLQQCIKVHVGLHHSTSTTFHILSNPCLNWLCVNDHCADKTPDQNIRFDERSYINLEGSRLSNFLFLAIGNYKGFPRESFISQQRLWKNVWLTAL